MARYFWPLATNQNQPELYAFLREYEFYLCASTGLVWSHDDQESAENHVYMHIDRICDLRKCHQTTFKKYVIWSILESITQNQVSTILT